MTSSFRLGLGNWLLAATERSTVEAGREPGPGAIHAVRDRALVVLRRSSGNDVPRRTVNVPHRRP